MRRKLIKNKIYFCIYMIYSIGILIGVIYGWIPEFQNIKIHPITLDSMGKTIYHVLLLSAILYPVLEFQDEVFNTYKRKKKHDK